MIPRHALSALTGGRAGWGMAAVVRLSLDAKAAPQSYRAQRDEDTTRSA
jgi:hypothetical protein